MNLTETYIRNFYKSIGINDPLLLAIETVIEHLNMKLIYWQHSSAIARRKDKYIMHINKSINRMRQWQDFGHEMYHYCHDHVVYDRLHETYEQYGESKADYFAYHFCVPTFMLLDLKEVSVNVISNLFNVEYDFALRRLEMYQNKILSKGVVM